MSQNARPTQETKYAFFLTLDVTDSEIVENEFLFLTLLKYSQLVLITQLDLGNTQH